MGLQEAMIMIREVFESEIEPFLGLLAEAEAGTHYDKGNPAHVSWLMEKVHRHYGRGVRFFGLFEGARAVGVIGLLVETHLQHNWGLGYITDLAVDSDSRRRGYGSRLMEFVDEEARRMNCYCVYVDTYAADVRNVAFYTRNGYVPVAVLPDANGPGDEGQVWLRKLMVRGSEPHPEG